MKMLLGILILLGAASIGRAQTVVAAPLYFNSAAQTVPGAIPTSSTCLIGFAATCKFVLPVGSSDPYLCHIDLTGTGQTITLSDINTVDWIVNGGALGSSGAPSGFSWDTPNGDAGCRWFPGGIYIVAGSGGATGNLKFKYLRNGVL